MVALETVNTPVEFVIELRSGEEWHSEAIHLLPRDHFTVTALGNDRFYAGLFRRPYYVQYRGAAGGAFKFDFGEDRRSWTLDDTLEKDDDYYLVFRVGVFTAGTTTIKVRWLVKRPA